MKDKDLLCKNSIFFNVEDIMVSVTTANLYSRRSIFINMKTSIIDVGRSKKGLER